MQDWGEIWVSSAFHHGYGKTCSPAITRCNAEKPGRRELFSGFYYY